MSSDRTQPLILVVDDDQILRIAAQECLESSGFSVIEAEDAVGIGGALHLAAVGQEGARERIREVLSSAGLSELQDFVAMA